MLRHQITRDANFAWKGCVNELNSFSEIGFKMFAIIYFLVA